MNTKTFEVVTEVSIDRGAWRAYGYGDQPSKQEVSQFFTEQVGLSGLDLASTVVVRYLGAPGLYRVSVQVTAYVPNWRRLGFGDTASKFEVHGAFQNFLNRVSKTVKVTVTNIRK